MSITFINLQPGPLLTRELVLTVIRDAQDWADDRIVVDISGVVSRAEDWLSGKIIYGNGGEITVAQTGEVLLYEPSEEVPLDHNGYFDIVHVELEQWRLRHGLTWSETGPTIDILMVSYHSVEFHTMGASFEPAIGQECDV